MIIINNIYSFFLKSTLKFNSNESVFPMNKKFIIIVIIIFLYN